MKLIPNWKTILKKAWSIRLILIAGLFSGAELVLPMYAGSLPRGRFAALSLVVTAAALVSRLVAQKGLNNAD